MPFLWFVGGSQLPKLSFCVKDFMFVLHTIITGNNMPIKNSLGEEWYGDTCMGIVLNVSFLKLTGAHLGDLLVVIGLWSIHSL